MIPQHIAERKGARSLKDLSPEVIEYLNAGKIETKNLIEWLATDQLVLLRTVLESAKKLDWHDSFAAAVNAQKKPTANSNTKIIGETFIQLTDSNFVKMNLSNHPSDIVRCWSCWAESLFQNSIENLLKAMKPYAADAHFGVREVVIFASKERLIVDLDKAMAILSGWISDEDENVRRYAVEALRPVGVWTKKILEFQENPEKGLHILEPLRSDSSKYVRDSVGNWLNDASKSKPDWVQAVCSRWKAESATKETAYILKRGLRTIEKNK
ncbi:DNA alkylation repair protein [Poritiphilus flavus]|uniref:DNA alkylation repair protein n=1 Tax=Poritiphilus flavus TaxID=2697053 RepID=A0A6L9E987_9FLAO|nr:DNA alkylation repair protein [Poritiphilus flavus]NAS11141.1 DNA alkylation repair protein [Poritiphilus flavus]